jgi:hypothetical protein
VRVGAKPGDQFLDEGVLVAGGDGDVRLALGPERRGLLVVTPRGRGAG